MKNTLIRLSLWLGLIVSCSVFMTLPACTNDEAASADALPEQSAPQSVAAPTTSAASPSSDERGAPPQSGRPIQAPQTPIVQAIYLHNIERVEELLDEGVDVNEQDVNWYSLLHHAIRAEDQQIVKLLLDRGADVNIRARLNITPLIWAVRTQNLDICRLLVEHGAEVNAKGGVDGEWTALRFASESNLVHIVDYLVSVGGSL